MTFSLNLTSQIGGSSKFKLGSLTISSRLWLIVASALVGVMSQAGVSLYSESKILTDERYNSVRQNVEVAHALIVHYHEQVVKGKLLEDEGKLRAVEAVKALRYGGAEYFWINDMQPKMVMHPMKPELDGKDLTENKDPEGKHLFVEMVNVVKTGGVGFVPYMWPKPGSANPVPKISYVKGFEPWGWVVGSGVYSDTIDTAIRNRLITIVAGCLVLAGILITIGMMIRHSLLSQFGGEPVCAEMITLQIAQGNLSMDVALKPGDESSLLHAIKSMRGNFSGIVAKVRVGSEGVAAHSAEIAQGNNNLSSRTESQASALEQTTASMDDQAGATMTEVVSAIKLVTDIMGEISASSSEQSHGVAQVGQAVRLMDETTQQNAALVQEIAASAGNLKSQAQDLVQTVEVFKLGASDTLVRTTVRAAAPVRTIGKGGERRTVAYAPSKSTPTPA